MPSNPTLICQIANPDIYLPCKVEVDGLRCERIELHDSDHWLGEHTIRHRIAGAEVSCDVIEGVTRSSNELKTELRSEAAGDVEELEEVAFEKHPLSKKAVGIIAAFGIILAGVLGYAVPQIKDQASSLPFVGSSGAITAKNNEMLGWKGQPVAGTNPVQKALGEAGKVSDPAVFIFDNGKENEGRKTFDAYLDFSTQKSRDFIILNHEALEAMVEDGKIELRLHIIPTSDPFTLYTAEFLAEVFHFAPDKAWEALIKAITVRVTSEEAALKPKEVAKSFEAIAKKLEIEDIDAEGLQNGTFVSWALSVSDNPKLTVGLRLPALFIDDKSLGTLKTMDLTKSSEFSKLLNG